ncbi:MAG: hypothetical protein RMY28_016380 [Nostoc sp. ChiSLP01]|nr:hypothetical protein [Nostoc sp. ChiSLP01]
MTVPSQTLTVRQAKRSISVTRRVQNLGILNFGEVGDKASLNLNFSDCVYSTNKQARPGFPT